MEDNFEDDERELRKAIREFERVKYGAECGAPVFRPGFKEQYDRIAKYL